MPIIINDIPQGTPEWMDLRLGNPGASNASKILTTRGERSKQAEEYILQLAGELVAGKQEETYKSFHMTNGLDREEEARSVYAMEYEVDIEQVALVYKDDRKMFHASPDGLIGLNSGIEIKCPMLKTHIKYLFDKRLPTDYFSQVQMTLYICEREYWQFLSYYPDLPIFTIKCERDEKYISRLAEELEKFCYELAGKIKELKEMQN